MDISQFMSDIDIEEPDFSKIHISYRNLRPSRLVEFAIQNQEGMLSNNGVLVVRTGQHTGRSPNDKYIVKRDELDESDIWWGKVNHPISPRSFKQLFFKIQQYIIGRRAYIQDVYAGADLKYQMGLRIITEQAWTSLFAHNLFIRPTEIQLTTHNPIYTLIHCPSVKADPVEDQTNSSTFIALDLDHRNILIGGSAYAGEVKKAIFSALNFELPRQGVLSMHCSANIGESGDVALFFGLSGTGKTTLSSDPQRSLIGDDEHGWSDEGIFNLEGGCYAKTIRLRQDLEPLIWTAVHQFGTVLENVVINPNTREPDYDDSTYTENTRAAYPINAIPNYIESGCGGHPRHIFFLCADAFSLLPPIARLTTEQAEYYFLSGYTAKVAGTERGLGKEPVATFSACFAAPFLPLSPRVYSNLFREKIVKFKPTVWLVNSGWSGGPYGIGKRIPLPYTRKLIQSALNQNLDKVSFHQEPYFNLSIPDRCPNIPDEILNPVLSWKDRESYENRVRILKEQFAINSKQCGF